jgi:hypothetical protein
MFVILRYLRRLGRCNSTVPASRIYWRKRLGFTPEICNDPPPDRELHHAGDRVMLSDKIKALKTTMSLARAGDLKFNGGLLAMFQRQLSDIHEQVLQLEAAQVPQASRLPAPLAAAARLPKLGPPANDRRQH